MLCKHCDIDLAVREVYHELLQGSEPPTLRLVQRLCCPKCKGETLLHSPLPVVVKDA